MENRRSGLTQTRQASRSKLITTFTLLALFSVALLAFSSSSRSANTKSEIARGETEISTKRIAGPGGNVIPRALQATQVNSQHVLPASYYNLRGNLSATLTLNNKGPQPLDVQPTLFSLNGQRLDVPPVTVPGTSFRVIDLRQWVVPGAGFDEGSLQVLHYGMDMQLGAQVKIIDADHSLIFAEQLMQMMAMSSRLEGVWWLRSPKNNVRLVLSNTSDLTLAATVNIDGIAPKQIRPLTIDLASHETRVLDPISFAANGNGTLHQSGGVSISYNGAPGSLLAHGLIDEQSMGFSSSIEFSDPSMAHSSRLNGGGLRLALVGGKELTPVVVARNIGNTESIINGSMPYTTDDGTASVLDIPQVRLGPGEVETINVSRAIRSHRIDVERLASAGLEFTYSTAPGTVVMSALSVSRDGNQVFRLPFIDADAEPSSTGGYPWFINGSSSTVVYITNVTDQRQQYALQLNFAGGVYAPGLKTIEPKQTAALDVRSLRDGQVADEHGTPIPRNATRGQIHWSVIGGENLVLIGRAEQADLAKGMSSSYACVNCCPDSCAQTWVDPPSVSGFSGQTQQFTPFQQNEDCFGNLLNPFLVLSASWNSSNTAVASVDSSGFATAQGVGNTSIGANWSAWLWDQNPNKTCFKTHIFPNPTALCDVDTLRIRVTNAPVPDDTQDSVSGGVVAGQPFFILVEAIDVNGHVDLLVNQSVAVTSSRTLDSSEIGLPSSFSLSSGSYLKIVTLNRVNGTERGTKFTFTPGGGGHTDLYLYTYFNVIATREGLVGGTTACGHVITVNDHFVALPSTGLCATGILLRNGGPSPGVSTTVRDVGPWFPHSPATTGNPCNGGNDPYWNTGGVPRTETVTCDSNDAGIDLADGTFADLGLTGATRILWRFQ
jgi:hypothetical protein